MVFFLDFGEQMNFELLPDLRGDVSAVCKLCHCRVEMSVIINLLPTPASQNISVPPRMPRLITVYTLR